MTGFMSITLPWHNIALEADALKRVISPAGPCGGVVVDYTGRGLAGRGGRIAIRAWTRASGVGCRFRIINAYVPPPPGVPTPFEWGDEAQVKVPLGSSFHDYRFERHDCPEYAVAVNISSRLRHEPEDESCQRHPMRHAARPV